MRRSSILTASLISAALVFGASAQAATWVVDQNHSSVGFKIRHLFTKLPGSFTKFAGTIEFDPAAPEAGSVDIAIDPASISTRNEHRDKDLRSDNFFDVEKFPTLTYQSTKVIQGEGNAFTVEGNLTMHGVTKPVTLAAVFLGADGKVAGFEATATLNRKDFGIIWNKTLDSGGVLLGDDVEVVITIEAKTPTKEKS